MVKSVKSVKSTKAPPPIAYGRAGRAGSAQSRPHGSRGPTKALQAWRSRGSWDVTLKTAVGVRFHPG